MSTMQPPGWLDERAHGLGITFADGEVETLGRYLGLLLDTTQRMNLTAIKDPDEAWEKHILDSLSLLPVVAELGEEPRMIDVGSGGGLPGIPLAITNPGVRVTLLDATAKKCAFLEGVAQELGLPNVDVVNTRAEGAGRDAAHRERYDLVTARAVGRLAVLAELGVPLARVGGLCALIKGQRADEELAEAKPALHMLHTAHAGTIDTPTGRVVVLEKLRSTPRAYPRRDGEPKRSPLGVHDGHAEGAG